MFILNLSRIVNKKGDILCQENQLSQETGK